MTRSTTFKLAFTLEDEVDVTIQKEDGMIVGFSVNYRTKINDRWHDVIRYDTAHGTTHLHKFWISQEIIPLSECTAMHMKTAIIEATKDIKVNWERYKRYLLEKVRRNGK